MRTGSNSPIGILILGLIFIGAGIFMTFIFGQLGELSCTRQEPSSYQCTHAKKIFGLIPWHEEELAIIQRASLAESCDSDGCSYRVEMITADGGVPLVAYYSGGTGAHERESKKIEQINDFISDPDAEKLELKAGLFEMLLSFLPLFFVVFGVIACISGLRSFLENFNEIR
jgi:hypothetical protein